MEDEKRENDVVLKIAAVLAIILLIVLVVMFDAPRAHGATAGPSDCTALVSAGSGWTNGSDACTSNDTRATYIGTTQGVLTLGTYGFSVPTGATINGIQLDVECQGNTVSPVGNRNFQATLTKDGTTDAVAYRNDGSTNCGLSTDTTRSFGGAADLWGGSFSVSDVNGSGFGPRIKATNTGAGNRLVDSLLITITYTSASRRSVLITETRRAGGTLVARTERRTP